MVSMVVWLRAYRRGSPSQIQQPTVHGQRCLYHKHANGTHLFKVEEDRVEAEEQKGNGSCEPAKGLVV